MLADWGADVVKVETPEGDPIRWQFPAAPGASGSANFEFDNRGKRSVVLDYRSDVGRAALMGLIGRADIFITNKLPGSLRRAGLDFDSLRERFPRLIYASVTGYGLQGPAADLAAFDIHAFWSRSGLAGQMWPEDAEPLSWRPGIGDHVSALAAALGVVVALYERTQSGKGQLVEGSLVRSGVYTGGFDIAEQLRRGLTIPSQRRGAPGARASTYYLTADRRWICIWARSLAEWRQIFGAVDRADLAEDARFASSEAIDRNGSGLTAELESAFAAFTLGEIGRRLDAAEIIWSPQLSASEVTVDEFATAAGCFVDVEDGQGGTFRAPAPPVRLAGGDGTKRPPPRVGQHTDEVLAEIGFTADQIADARAAGAVA